MITPSTRKGKYEIANGTFLFLGLVLTLVFGKQRACPVCCRHFGRDGIMNRYETSGNEVWQCTHLDCGFAFPVDLDSPDFVNELAAERIKYLETLPAAA